MHTSLPSTIEYLKQFVSDDRNALFDRLIRHRTEYLTLVLEDLYQPHNISAVLRSCDCFGVQNVHVIERQYTFEDNSEISMGSRDWLTLHRYPQGPDNLAEAIRTLRGQGYRIIATTPHERDVMIDDLDLARGKMAFLLGTELTGLSAEALEMADEYVKVPIYGFTESYNVSVCAALLMYSVVQRLHCSGIPWQLSGTSRDRVLFAWYRNAVKSVDRILERYYGAPTGRQSGP